MSDPNIITVTLNPSLDRTLITHYLGIGYHNRTIEATRLDPAGDGFTISRALHQLSCRTHAVVLLGTDATGSAYRALAAEEAFPFTALTQEGQTRSSTILLDTGTGLETQITDEGSPVTETALDNARDTLRSLARPGDIVVFAGPLPKNAPKDTYARLTEVVHGCGARVAVSASGAALGDTLPAAPDMITLTQVELEGYFNYPVRELDDILTCARKIQEQGAESVLVEIREKDLALLASGEDALVVGVSLEHGGTTSGVWPAMIAGFLAERARRQTFDKALVTGAAAAGYTAAQVGHEFGTLIEVEAYSKKNALSRPEHLTTDRSEAKGENAETNEAV